jgi:hypothetical protein
MIPRPIYKIFAFLLLPVLPAVSLWLWFHYASEPKPYYLSYRSGFLYERLLVPPFPAFPGTRRQPERYSLLAIRCPQGYCLATPETFKARIPVIETTFPQSREQVRKLLDDSVYHGNPMNSLLWILTFSLFLWSLLLLSALILDYRRRLRQLNGIQILGRWPVLPNLFAGRFGRKISIDVAHVNDKTAPL